MTIARCFRVSRGLTLVFSSVFQGVSCHDFNSVFQGELGTDCSCVFHGESGLHVSGCRGLTVAPCFRVCVVDFLELRGSGCEEWGRCWPVDQEFQYKCRPYKCFVSGIAGSYRHYQVRAVGQQRKFFLLSLLLSKQL